jgi:hypothetical protein
MRTMMAAFALVLALVLTLASGCCVRVDDGCGHHGGGGGWHHGGGGGGGHR